MGTGGEKFPQSWRRQRDSGGSHNPGDIEARRPRGTDQFRLERGGI
jgi:hypothetical protein